MAMNGNMNFTPRRLRVVVTGGSSGIGASIVARFAEEGHLVFLSYLTSKTDAESLVSRYPTQVRASKLDQGDFECVCRFGREVEEWCGEDGVDVLVNNAALGTATVSDYVSNCLRNKNDGGFQLNGNGCEKDDVGLKVIRKAIEDEAMMRVNALGPLWVTQQLRGTLRRCEKRCGRSMIVFIGSIGGGGPVPFPEHRPADGMGKAALCQYAKHLAAEHIQDGIDVFCVNPGATETNMFIRSTLEKVKDREEFIGNMPKARLIQPEQIASVVSWLASSKDSSVMHGAIIDASMGLGVRPGLQTEMDPACGKQRIQKKSAR